MKSAFYCQSIPNRDWKERHETVWLHLCRSVGQAILSPAVPALLLTLLSTLPARADDHWIRLTTAHVEMDTNADEKKAREALLHFERVREFFLQASPVKTTTEFPVRIVAFKDPQQFGIYAPNSLVKAFFAPGPVRDTIVMEDPSPENYGVTIHEYVHMIVRHSGLRLPVWLNEGWAQVYETLKPVKDGVAVGDLIQRHVTTLDHEPWLTLSELEAFDVHSAVYSETTKVGMVYAESWALVHMLYLSPDYKNNFGKFIGLTNKGIGIDAAVESAFGKTSTQVFTDLHTYLARKNLYGTVFLTPFEKPGEVPVVTALTTYDADLLLADLQAGSSHFAVALRSYQRLEDEDPKRPEAYESAGYLAVKMNDKESARKEFRKAFDRGSTDPQLCIQLATLEREAKQPPGVVMEELARAVKLRPDFTEALFELGILKFGARDFAAALPLLEKVGAVSPERTTVFRAALAYSSLQMGKLDTARSNAQAIRKAAQSPAETHAADRLIQLIDARSQGPAAALPGEKQVRAEGTAVGLRCAAAGSDSMSKMGITIGGKQMLFDLPDEKAVEIVKRAGATTEMKCGPLQPFPLVVEYAPASVMNKESAGIIRRLEY